MRNEARRRKRLQRLDVPTLEVLLTAVAASDPRRSAPPSLSESVIQETLDDQREYCQLIADEIRRRG